MNKCPCFSKKKYEECCKSLHEGEPPVSAVALMRSRFAAYKMGLADYIIKTTHSGSVHYNKDVFSWQGDILDFSSTTSFDDLKILDSSEDMVTFTATLTQEGKDVSFTEKSLFKEENGILKYFSGTHV